MKKLFYILFIMSFSYFIFCQDMSSDNSTDIDQIRKELLSLQNDVKELKEKNLWFSFKFEGSVKAIFGASLWVKEGLTINKSFPLTLGFDFENKIRMSMDIANKVVSSGFTKSDDGTEISVKLKIKSMGLTDIEPKGSWYVMDATDDYGRPTKVYFPRYEGGSSNIVFGNFQVVFEEAKVKNLLGTGVFFNYEDFKEVQKYYGVTALVDVLKLNHKFFNNGFINDSTILYYSFDPKDYEPTAEESLAVKFWTNNMLFANPSNSDANQKPHGFSIGFEKQVAGSGKEGVIPYVEGGGASKDAFDPKYFEDNQIDAGFFLRGGVELFSKNKFNFYPKASFSVAFQTQTDSTADVDPAKGNVNFATGLSLPLEVNLPTGKEDKIKLALDWNLDAYFASKAVSTILSFSPEVVLFNKRFTFSIPFIYSFKTNQGGFIRIGNESVKWLSQEYEDHIINLGFKIGFDSTNLFSDFFRYSVSNQIYFVYNYVNNNPEIFFYEILKNEFIFTDVGPKTLKLYVDFGIGAAKNVRLMSSNYYYDTVNNRWVDKTTRKTVTLDQKNRWGEWNVLSIETGFSMDIIKNLSWGIALESPKLLLGVENPIGTQKNFGTIKIWSELKL
ncbi:MAG: hypothetical protein A2086_15160 [Spirochaetes bacterium GWD1_27_9]|nr:MAG: hypothetical protein A2Z98_01900 [Spirochaetes bacterium GWB1_27_13]OHD26592.1 MAG: hypothetical protein A2Y34_10390 [Spirochaetes bacterium GWC1_27_15]OHD32619.1 MAG: hypothetical protein A2086_15160 [Spirochaetes bacterium GWD1_27_9]